MSKVYVVEEYDLDFDVAVVVGVAKSKQSWEKMISDRYAIPIKDLEEDNSKAGRSERTAARYKINIPYAPSEYEQYLVTVQGYDVQ